MKRLTQPPNNRRILHVLTLLTALFLSLTGQAQSQIAAARPTFPLIRLARHVSGEAAITALGDQLPAVAQFYNKSPDELKALLRREKSLHVDPEGRLYYICDWQAD